MKRFFNYFSLNQTEQRGFILLLLLILLVLFVPYSVKRCNSENSIHYDLVKLEHEVVKRESTNLSSSNQLKSSDTYKVNKAITYFPFDPNLIDESSWDKLGFTEKQIKVIMNYRAKGGRFYKKEDLSKIYSISASDYARIAPYIRIEKSNKKENINDANVRELKPIDNTNIVIDINVSDTIGWQRLQGIGPVLSKRIVKYREALGGFHRIEQLKEVYGLPIETYDHIKSKLMISPSFRIHKININTCSEDELNKHPYFNRKQVKTILNYRNNHGKFNKLESLSQIQSLDSVFLRKIGNYLEY